MSARRLTPAERKRLSPEERVHARQGLCTWQTATGLPWTKLCGTPATRGLLCGEHDKDLAELYGQVREDTKSER